MAYNKIQISLRRFYTINRITPSKSMRPTSNTPKQVSCSAQSFQRAICQFIGWFETFSFFIFLQMRVWLWVVLLPKWCVAQVVQIAVGKVESSEELPDRAVVPVKNGEHSCELRPTLTAGIYWFQLLWPRICSPVAHYNRFHLLLVY